MFVVVLTVRACRRSTRFGRRHFACVTMISPPNADIAVKTYTKFATQANPHLSYIVLSFCAVSRIIHSDPSFLPLSRSFAQITSIFLCPTISTQRAQRSLPVLPQSRAISAENHHPETVYGSSKGPFTLFFV